MLGHGGVAARVGRSGSDDPYAEKLERHANIERIKSAFELLIIVLPKTSQRLYQQDWRILAIQGQLALTIGRNDRFHVAGKAPETASIVTIVFKWPGPTYSDGRLKDGSLPNQ